MRAEGKDLLEALDEKVRDMYNKSNIKHGRLVMKFDFDQVIDRHNTCSSKFDLAATHGYPEDILPMWTADMDFQAPEVPHGDGQLGWMIPM